MRAQRRLASRGKSVERSAQLTVSHRNRTVPLTGPSRVVLGRNVGMCVPWATISTNPRVLRGPTAALTGILGGVSSRAVCVRLPVPSSHRVSQTEPCTIDASRLSARMAHAELPAHVTRPVPRALALSGGYLEGGHSPWKGASNHPIHIPPARPPPPP